MKIRTYINLIFIELGYTSAAILIGKDFIFGSAITIGVIAAVFLLVDILNGDT